MKRIIAGALLILFAGISVQIMGQTAQKKKDNIKKITFTVHGDCGMCKRRIEGAAKSVNGVKTASWENEFQMITVTYDETRTKPINIHKAIAAAGHDTEKVKADDKKYKSLPECCRYRGKKK